MSLRICVIGTTLLTALAALWSGCSAGDSASSAGDAATHSPATPAETTTASAPAPGTATRYVTARVRTGTQPCGILGAAGRIWVSNFGDDTLVSIDPDTLKVSRPVRVGDQPCGLAYGAGSIWVEDYNSFEVTRVDARTGTVQTTYDVGYYPYDVTFADGSAWVSNNGDGTVSRIDAATDRVAQIKVGGTPIGAAAVAGTVWVGIGAEGIVGIDASTGKVTRRISTNASAGWTAYDRNHIWVNVGATAVEIDPSTGTVSRRVQLGSKPEDGSLIDGTLWIGDANGALYRARDGRVLPPIASGVTNPFVLVGYRGDVWTVDFAGTRVVRIDPGQVE